MWLLLVGIAVGVVVTGLLRAWRRYEADSMASLHDDVEVLRGRIERLTRRIEALEAIEAADSKPLEAVEEDSSGAGTEAVRGRTKQR